jgi:hypothetical protein
MAENGKEKVEGQETGQQKPKTKTSFRGISSDPAYEILFSTHAAMTNL